jgi:multicomponent K+:H+ antiporter subunit F
MSATILAVAVSIAQLALVAAMLLAMLRMLWGPRAQDRVLALDALYINAMLLMVTIGMRTGSAFFFEAALIISMLGFVATLAMAKFLMRGELIE